MVFSLKKTCMLLRLYDIQLTYFFGYGCSGVMERLAASVAVAI